MNLVEVIIIVYIVFSFIFILTLIVNNNSLTRQLKITDNTNETLLIKTRQQRDKLDVLSNQIKDLVNENAIFYNRDKDSKRKLKLFKDNYYHKLIYNKKYNHLRKQVIVKLQEKYNIPRYVIKDIYDKLKTKKK